MNNTTLQRGLIAGLIAGLTLGVLFFVDYGPGNSLRVPAGWFGLSHAAGATWIGFALLIVLGGLFGLLFGVLQRDKAVLLGRSLVLGLAMGVAWWVIVVLLIGIVLNHVRIDIGGFLFSFIMLLLYGMLLGTLYFQRSAPRPAGYEKAIANAA